MKKFNLKGAATLKITTLCLMTLSLMSLSMMAISIMTFCTRILIIMTLGIPIKIWNPTYNTHYNNSSTHHSDTYWHLMLMLSVILWVSFMIIVTNKHLMMSVIMLSVGMLSVVMLSSLYWALVCWASSYWVQLCWALLCWVPLCWALLRWCHYAKCRYAECRVAVWKALGWWCYDFCDDRNTPKICRSGGFIEDRN